MEPIVLFSIQFTMSLLVYILIAVWYGAPRLSKLPREIALEPLLWVHVFRIVGGTILAPGAVDAGVPMDFRVMVGYGDLFTALLAIVALIALRTRFQAGESRPGHGQDRRREGSGFHGGDLKFAVHRRAGPDAQQARPDDLHDLFGRGRTFLLVRRGGFHSRPQQVGQSAAGHGQRRKWRKKQATKK